MSNRRIASQSQRKTPFLSLLMLFLGNCVRGKGGWGVFFITVKKRKKKNNVLIIVDMILSWKNIL